MNAARSNSDALCIHFMEHLSRHFGLVIAYLLPGFVALAGVAPFAPIVSTWLRADQSASFGAPVYALLAATAAGMVVSCFRWLIIDRVHALTGLGNPIFNAQALEEKPAAFAYLVENHYRYYQFYANTLVGVVWAYAVHRLLGISHFSIGTDIGILILCATLFMGSHDALSKYRMRSQKLTGQR